MHYFSICGEILSKRQSNASVYCKGLLFRHVLSLSGIKFIKMTLSED